MSISPDKLIPMDSELGQLLLQLTEDTDSRTWKVANITNDLIAEIEGGDVTKADIYRAVATRCKGKKPNTIRRWAEVAADFDSDIQKEYKELLSFDHFKVSRRLFKEGYSPSIDYVLEWCVQGDDDKITAGRFHTVGEAIQHFVPAGNFENQLYKAWSKTKDKLYDLFLIHDNDFERKQLLEYWTQINYIVDGLDKS
jgi:hypothetical protein